MTLVYLLQPLENLLRHVLNGIHSVGLPWAWSIVALTLIVRVLLVPLTVKQIHSMQNMQAHAPAMKELQRKYKGDRAKLNEELMKFYKENNINPASSCLPLVAQFPIGLVLYWMTTNLWTVGQGLITRRLMPKVAPPATQKRSSRTPPKETSGDGVAAAPEPPKPSGQPRRVKRKKKARR